MATRLLGLTIVLVVAVLNLPAAGQTAVSVEPLGALARPSPLEAVPATSRSARER